MKTNTNWNLLTKYINNECSKEEKLLFEQWLSLSNENQQYFNQIKEAWGAYGVGHVSFSLDKEEAWKKINHSIGENKSKTRKLIVWSVRIAASVLLLIGLFYLVNIESVKIDNQELTALTVEKSSNPRKLILPDSSVVWLNKSTTIKYPKEFAKEERRVYLNGEAFFEVKKNSTWPFFIETKNTVTRVVGTSFNLRAYDFEDEVKIIVNSGKVEFSSKTEKNNKVILTKELAGIYNKSKNELVKTDIFDRNYQSWKTGKLIFLNTNLADVCKTLEKYYNRTIIIDGTNLKNMKISATFNNQKFEEVISIISQTLDISYKLKNDSIIYSFK